ncbi:MAG: hypothetical protein KC478_05240 [Bacteriovoracaceae bacterium]|nr:hypothetical protein [Bacteriovoracaceae bacterium]
MKNILSFVFIAKLFLLTSCGDLFMGKQKETSMSQLLSCSLDPSSLSKVFTENIKGDLLCLEESLHLFVDVVKTDRPGTLSYRELTSYVQKNLEDVDTNLLEALKGFFQLNSLLSGDDPMYVKKENVKGLIKMLVLVNELMVNNNIYEYFTSKKPTTYDQHLERKSIVFNVFSNMEKALSEFFKANNNEINLVDFLAHFKGVDAEVVKASSAMLFVKTAFLGGEKEVLTAKELRRLMLMLADAGKIIFDIVKLPNVEHSTNEREEIVESLKENFETIVVNIRPQAEKGLPIFDLDDIKALIDAYLPEYSSIFKYRKSILKAKEIFLGSASETFTSEELRILLQDIVLLNLKRGAFFYKAYAANAAILDENKPIKRSLPYIFASNSVERQFKKDFNRIAQDYRFFPDEDFVATFTSGIDRSAWGMFTISVLEDLTTRVFEHYTKKDEKAYGGYKLSQKQMANILVDFKDVLTGSGLAFPDKEANTAETITLMTSLFQNQSDGKGNDIEVNETVEFLVTLGSAFQISNSAYNELQNKCELDEKGRIGTGCFKSQFASVFDLEIQDTRSPRKYDEYFPGIAKYARGLSETEVETFMTRVETFSRACAYYDDGESIPMSKGDFFLIFAGLINMESTYIRFNKGDYPGAEPNEVLDPSELNKAFKEVYKKAIEAGVPSYLEYAAPDVFRFLLDKGREPSISEMVLRVAIAGYPNITADRNSVAGVLKVISEGSEAKKSNPYPCEELR